MAHFTKIELEKSHVAVCPNCHEWLWKTGTNSGLFGKTSIEKAAQYLASDGDKIQFRAGPPAPTTAYTEFDAQLHKGNCPHCGEGYWFITAAFPETPVQNTEPPAFVCDEGYIDILDGGDGAFLGDRRVDQWTIMRQRACWQGREIRIDVHMIGPFPGGDSLVGPNGVSRCQQSDTEGRDIWAMAAEIVARIAPDAVDFLRS